MANSNGAHILGRVTAWLGLLCGIFTIVVWGFLLSDLKPKIKVDKDDAVKDINKYYWRETMFTFAPSVFFDIWTPFVMGLISILCHFSNFDLSWMCKTYAHYFIWNFVLALFGNLGYAGGLGIIASAFSLLTALLSLICAFVVRNESPQLNLQTPKMPQMR
ncbi:hypothetical protein cyc_03609 [Cyclospora cayetanensis]|uniref:Transmembrane protein n=1 Tax=Cyclospora cayetanensis TaxID=88456 RepID=A0A1D3CSY8_9EIME|nr:hypothetical protein cyc_03609 [Cyclospora cayetanensis]